MRNLFVNYQAIKFFWSIGWKVKNLHVLRNCMLCTSCKKQQREKKIGLLLLLYWSEKGTRVVLPVHLLAFLFCWNYRQQCKTSTHKKAKKKKRKNREITGKHLSDFQYECLCFNFLPICRSDLFICAVCFFTYKVTSWLLIVAILFDKTQVFFYFPKAHTLFLSFLQRNLAVRYLFTTHLPFSP